jgi:hypothetical protein
MTVVIIPNDARQELLFHIVFMLFIPVEYKKHLHVTFVMHRE